ncbi:MAG: DUF898 domain-containing protein [Hyphomicrobiaceae bacterium]|nr:DUF898 domain-containing protein [Hyphomicrobiaceae bacterium]
MSLLNLGLNILTLGLYQFWGRVEVRKRIWAAVRLGGEPLSYSGTGPELFRGFLMALTVIGIPALLFPLVLFVAIGNSGLSIAQVVLYVVFAFLFGWAVWRAQRYRLSRTSWRGIRLSLDGSGLGYAWASFWTMALIPITLGWIVPWRSTMLQGRLIGGMALGDRRFEFAASTGPLYWRYLVVWLVNLMLIALSLVILAAAGGTVTGLSKNAAAARSAFVLVPGLLLLFLIYGLTSAWYRAAQFNHFARSTRLGDTRFDGRMSGWGLFGLTFSNWLLIVGSLGILLPVAQTRNAAYFVHHLDVIGGDDLDTITQSLADPRAARGEGLANAFNFDAF